MLFGSGELLPRNFNNGVLDGYHTGSVPPFEHGFGLVETLLSLCCGNRSSEQTTRQLVDLKLQWLLIVGNGNWQIVLLPKSCQIGLRLNKSTAQLFKLCIQSSRRLPVSSRS